MLLLHSGLEHTIRKPGGQDMSRCSFGWAPTCRCALFVTCCHLSLIPLYWTCFNLTQGILLCCSSACLSLCFGSHTIGILHHQFCWTGTLDLLVVGQFQWHTDRKELQKLQSNSTSHWSTAGRVEQITWEDNSLDRGAQRLCEEFVPRSIKLSAKITVTIGDHVTVCVFGRGVRLRPSKPHRLQRGLASKAMLSSNSAWWSWWHHTLACVPLPLLHRKLLGHVCLPPPINPCLVDALWKTVPKTWSSGTGPELNERRGSWSHFKSTIDLELHQQRSLTARWAAKACHLRSE